MRSAGRAEGVGRASWSAGERDEAGRGEGETHDGEPCGLEDLRELDGDVSEHVVVLRPLGVRRVDVETGTWGTGRMLALSVGALAPPRAGAEGQRQDKGGEEKGDRPNTHRRRSPSCPSRPRRPRRGARCRGRGSRCPPWPRGRGSCPSARCEDEGQRGQHGACGGHGRGAPRAGIEWGDEKGEEVRQRGGARTRYLRCR